MVERWGQVGTPTAAARLLQVEALLDLCQTERAAARLERLPPDAIEPLPRARVEARLLVGRGWLDRARDVLDRARRLAPDDAELARLSVEAHRSSAETPDRPAADAPFDAQLAAAEALLRTGAFLKARRVLEGLDRLHPGHRRVADLLWALQGDYDLPGTLDAVVRTFAPEAPDGGLDLGAPTEVDEVELGAEETQATRLADLEAAMISGDGADEDTAVLRVHGGWLEEETGVLRVQGAWLDTTNPGRDAERVPRPPDEPADEAEEAVVLLARETPLPPPRTARPLPSPRPAPRPTRSRPAPPPPPEPVAAEDLEEIDDVEEIGPEAEAVAADDEPQLVWLLAAAAVLGATGLLALLALLWVGLR